MMEFASRTHQDHNPTQWRDYLPAFMDQSAMPIRVEKWRVDGEIVYRLVGIMWGGEEVTLSLDVRFNGGAWSAVDVCPPMRDNSSWTTWEYAWRPSATGNHEIQCGIADSSIRTRRLDMGWYNRSVTVDEV